MQSRNTKLILCLFCFLTKLTAHCAYRIASSFGCPMCSNFAKQILSRPSYSRLSYSLIIAIISSSISLSRASGVARGGKGGTCLPFYSRKCDMCSLYYDQLFAKQITSYFSQRDLLSILLAKTLIKLIFCFTMIAWTLARYIGQSSICERIGRERPFN